jgi:hypothetical protein
MAPERVIAGDFRSVVSLNRDSSKRYRRTTVQYAIYTRPIFSVRPSAPHCPFVHKIREMREGADADHKHE